MRAWTDSDRARVWCIQNESIDHALPKVSTVSSRNFSGYNPVRYLLGLLINVKCMHLVHIFGMDSDYINPRYFCLFNNIYHARVNSAKFRE